MWCSSCQQDVPGVGHAVIGRIVCSRCQRPSRSEKPAYTARVCDEGIPLDEPVAAAMAAAAPPFRGDDWSARQRVRALGRELRRPTAAAAAGSSRIPPSPRRLDPPPDLFDHLERATAPNLPPISPQPTAAAPRRAARSESGQLLAWAIVLAGAVALAAGIGLVGWSLAAQEMRHWNLALGLSLGGQGTLIFGLVLVVSRLWRNSRNTAGRLQDVQVRLGQLQHTADALLATRSGGAPAFYADLVRGASPQLLLANLKGQLDQLATRLGNGS